MEQIIYIIIESRVLIKLLTFVFLVQAHVKIAHLFLYTSVSNMTISIYMRGLQVKKENVVQSFLWLHFCYNFMHPLSLHLILDGVLQVKWFIYKD